MPESTKKLKLLEKWLSSSLMNNYKDLHLLPSQVHLSKIYRWLTYYFSHIELFIQSYYNKCNNIVIILEQANELHCYFWQKPVCRIYTCPQRASKKFITATDIEKEKISGNSSNVLIVLSIPYKIEMETESNQNYKVITKNWIKLVRYTHI